MSVQGGIWHFDGKPADREWLTRLSRSMAQHGPDGEFFHVSGSIGMVQRPFHTIAESRWERQPWISSTGNVITWDGRLDNADEIRDELDRHPYGEAALALLAFERWGTQGLGRLVGDFALSIWQPEQRKLLLARDCFAMRPLFYHLTKDRVFWCSDLARLVLQPGARWTLDDSYIAGYLVSYPEPEETPYQEIRGVGAASWVEITPERVKTGRFWNLDPGKRKDHCKTDTDYEETFRHLFRQSVRRRLRSDSPVLAQLSGGMDSSSIVCMADEILKDEPGLAPRLDTITHYDECEPTGDERQWAKYVEAKRGRAGRHLNTADFGGFSSTPPACFAPVPGLFASSLRFHQVYDGLMQASGCRVLLSGTGGDEFTGGVPDPFPQLADLLISGRLIAFARLLKQWSLAKKRPLHDMLWSAVLCAAPVSVNARWSGRAKVDPWICAGFATGQQLLARRLGIRRRTGKLLPTQRTSISTLRSLAGSNAGPLLPVGAREVRKPFQDRDLVEFLTSIPDDQLLRPGRRRFLLRRALNRIVPGEVLERRQKAVVIRRPMIRLTEYFPELNARDELQVDRFGYAHAERLREAVRAASSTAPTNLIGLIRLLALENWLESTAARFLASSASGAESAVPRSVSATSAG